ncbi:MAG TPA: hypothetical protein VFS05_05285 [Gemmatimonadaceae bacterium]|nr:hypothetical protein [Gemmatimonadaceae bacterium]
MTPRTALLALPLALAAALGGAGGAPRGAALGTVTVAGPPEADTLGTITPAFTVRTAGFAPGELPLVLRLQVARDSTFAAGALFADTTVAGDSAGIIVGPLPPGDPIFWRAIARTARGDSALSAIGGPRTVPPWATLLFPNATGGTTVATRRPTFTWSSPAVAPEVGAFTYRLELFGAGSRTPILSIPGITDTTFTPAVDLESNTSYRWAVVASLPGGLASRVQSRATFVIVDPAQPIATLLYQNFPNPFPSAAVSSTCIWFDLRQSGDVRLEVFDLRGSLVRTLIPSAELPARMAAGRYGRASLTGTPGGCDPRLTWDGVARDGRVVPSGVYLLRLVADGRTQIRKMVFRGR